jgi:dUTP pyrophosphatase
MSTYKLYLVEALPEISKYPVYGQYENSNAGVDLITVEDWVGIVGETHLLDLGVKAMLVNKATGAPVHYWLLPRSSIYKTGHMMANSVGVIDSSYRGTLKAPVVAVAPGAGFKAGARHFQIVAPDMGWIQEVQLVTALPATERGEGGFGSTGA